MRPQLTTIFLTDDAWWIHLAGLPDSNEERLVINGETPAERAAAVSKLVDEHGARATEVVLALPSQWCLAAEVQADGLVRRQRRIGLIYRLEEKLPIDAEQFAADFIEGPSRAFGVATAAEPLQPIITALAENGLYISAITPTAMLAVTAAASQADTNQPYVVLLEHEKLIDVITVIDGSPRRWTLCTAEPEALRLHLQQLQLSIDEALPIIAVDIDDAILSSLESQMDITSIQHASHSYWRLAIDTAAHLLQSGRPPTINLRRGPLASTNRLQVIQRPLLAATIAAIVFLLALTGGTLWRAHQYSQLTRSLHEQQVAAYRDAFPGQNVPAAILARLQSEARKLQGMRGNRTNLPEQLSVLHLLHDTLSNLPTQMRYRVLELRLDQQRIYIDGQARRHRDADTIAASLRTSGRFTIEPPRTENLPNNGVAFTLTGSPTPGETP